MGPIDSLKSAICLIFGEMPKEDPIKKQTLDFPDSLTSFSLSANSSLERVRPSGVKMHSHAPFGIFAMIASATLSSPAAISGVVVSSLRRYSDSYKR